MGSHELTIKPPGDDSTTTMKVLVVLALLGCALARPAYEYVDPDCIEEDLAIAEPGAYDSALGEPELVINFETEQGRSDSDFDDCEDLLTTEEVQTLPPVQKQEVTEECEDALTTEEVVVFNEPVFTDPPVLKQEVTEEPVYTTAEQKQLETEADCIDDELAVTEENPFLNFHVEKAIEADPILMAFDSPVEEIEECDDY